MSDVNRAQFRFDAATMRLEAQNDFLDGWLKMHEAALQNGTDDDRRRTHNEAVEAFEEILYLKEVRKRIWLHSLDIDPALRHEV